MADGPLLTIEEARLILHVTDPARDPEITLILAQASAIVRDYLKLRNNPEWTPETVPLVEKSAAGRVLVFLWEHRGDDAADDGDPAKFWRDLELLLARRRSPAYA